MNTSTMQTLLSQAQACFQSGRYREAATLAQQVAQAQPSLAPVRHLEASAHWMLGDRQAALQVVQAGLQHCPTDESLMVLHGRILLDMGHAEAARVALRECVHTHGQSLDGWTRYAIALQDLRRYEEARLAAMMALSIDPDAVLALLIYAQALKEGGQPEAAIAAVRRAVELQPENTTARALLMFFLLLGEGVTAMDLREESVQIARLLHQRRKPVVPVQARAPGPRIRLGVLSNDLCRHACAYFLIPLLANLDRSRVEVVVIGLNAFRDNVTATIEGLADRFINVAGKADTDIVSAVRAEGLDVLIDLGGYTGVSPLFYMVYGLAPVQLTWLGFPGGSGMPQVQYRISDAVADADGFDAHYVERLLRAPGTFCAYAPLVHDPLKVYAPEYQVAPTPALRNGHITFGSCNNAGKLTEGVLRLWQRVLARCPGSKLLVEAAGLELDPVRNELLQRMARAGIAEDRLILVPRDRARQYLTYHDIDIVLDAFPLTGGTTTCDALWMGVPVVTLAGQAFHSRMSATFLHDVGLDWLVCQSEAAYEEAAVQLAADVAQLNDLRLSIRPRFERSATSDAAGFAQWLQETLTGIVAQHRALPALEAGPQDGMAWQGRWHTTAELAQQIGALLAARDHASLQVLLERLSAKWCRHWLAAFALSEVAHQQGDQAGALELLMQGIGLRDDYLPLYQLLAGRLDEAGLPRDWLDALVNERFGVDLSAPAVVITAHEILQSQHMLEAA